jgi:uncharacterized protein
MHLMDNFAGEFLEQLEWSIIVFSMLAVLAGSITQGITGLGFGMVTAPALLLIDPIFVPVPMLILAMTISLLVVIRDKQHIDYKTLSISLGGRVPGTILAALTFTLIPLALYSIIFGVLILVAVILTSTKIKVLPNTVNILIASFASGFMGTLTSVGAPPMALVFQHGQANMVRSTLAMFFLIGCLFSLIVLYFFGSFTSQHLYVTAIFIPPLIIGFKVSSFLVPKIDQKLMRIFMLSIAGVSSAILILKSTLNYFA